MGRSRRPVSASCATASGALTGELPGLQPCAGV